MNRAQLVDAALVRVCALVAARDARTVLIDGPSGAGKTQFAARLSARLASAPGGADAVHLDDFYPGWHGLAAGSEMVWRDVLHLDRPGFWRWDWAANRRDEWVALEPTALLVVEGVGALTAASASAARARGGLVTVWLDGPREERRASALARDPGYEPWFETWEAQERAHFASVDLDAVGVDVRMEWSLKGDLENRHAGV